MFRMKFLSKDTSGDDEDSSADEKNGSERELHRERTADGMCCSPQSAPTIIYEGRVGKFGRIQRISESSNNVARPVACHDSTLKSFTVSPNVATAGSENCADVDLTSPEGPAQERLADKNISVTYIHHQTSLQCPDGEMNSVSSRAPERLVARTSSYLRCTSSGADSEWCTTSVAEGKPNSDLKENEAVQGMIKKLVQKSKLNVHDDRFAKSWDEPLLAAHDQTKLSQMAKKKAEIEAKRLAEEEQQNCERVQRELRDLANCVNTAPTPGGSTRESKLKKIFRFLTNPFTAFRSKKIQHGGYPIARETKGENNFVERSASISAHIIESTSNSGFCHPGPGGPVEIPHARLFSGCRTVSSGPTDSALALMRNAPQQRINKPNFQFAKVDSTQRDMPAWTREEYLRKNGRIPERSNGTKNNEELGGALGLNYFNQNLDNDMAGGVSSDCDSDSD